LARERPLAGLSSSAESERSLERLRVVWKGDWMGKLGNSY
jgi:hypothetical protein